MKERNVRNKAIKKTTPIATNGPLNRKKTHWGAAKGEATITGKFIMRGIVKHGRYGEPVKLPSKFTDVIIEKLRSKDTSKISAQFAFYGTINGNKVVFDCASKRDAKVEVTHSGLHRADVKFGKKGISITVMLDDDKGNLYPIIAKADYDKLFDTEMIWTIIKKEMAEDLGVRFNWKAPYYSQDYIDKRVRVMQRAVPRVDPETGEAKPSGKRGRPKLNKDDKPEEKFYDVKAVVDSVVEILDELEAVDKETVNQKPKGIYFAKKIKGTLRKAFVKGTKTKIEVGCQKGDGDYFDYKVFNLNLGDALEHSDLIEQIEIAVKEMWAKMKAPIKKGKFRGTTIHELRRQGKA